MTIYSQTLFFADAPLPNPETLKIEQPTKATVKDDPLIAKNWQITTYVGSVLVVLGVLAVVGIVSQNIEHVIALALIISSILIATIVVMAL